MTARGLAILLAPVLVVGAGLAACTASGETTAPAPSRTPAADPSSSRAPSPTTSATATTSARQPLAFAYDLHRSPLDLTLAQARALVAGAPVSWTTLGQPGGRVRFRAAPDVAAAERDPDVLVAVPAGALTPTVQVARVAGIDPLLSPRRYPLQTDAAQPPGRPTTVIVTGDVMLGRGVAARGDPRRSLRFLTDTLGGADLTIGNLESTLSTAGRPRQGNDSFAADPDVLPALARAGFDVLSLANNHTGDYGPRAFRQTLATIGASRIHQVGAGLDEQAAWRPVVVRRGGTTYGVIAFNAIGETPRATAERPGVASVHMQPRTGPLDRADLRRLTSTIRELARQVDVVLVFPHWGEQYTAVPVRDQRRVAESMVHAGADLVVGSHPHVVQGLQDVDGRPVVHSLGNLVFDMEARHEREGVLAQLVFWSGELKSMRLLPYVIGRDFAPRAVSGSRAARILGRVWRNSDPPYHR